MDALVNAGTLWLPFKLADQFDLKHPLFLLKHEVVFVIISCLILIAIVNFVGYAGRTRFPFILEVFGNFMFLGLSLLLWTQKQYSVLIVGSLGLTVTLIFDSDSLIPWGRLCFYGSLLLTEEHLRMPTCRTGMPILVQDAGYPQWICPLT